MKKILICLLVIAILGAGGFVGYKIYKDKKDDSCSDKDCSESSKNDNSIIGSWKNDELGYDFIYTFNEDGTGEYDAAGTIMEFTYEIDGNNISILYKGNTVSFDTTFKIKGDELNVVDSLNNDTIYKRIDSKQKNSSSETEKSDEKGTAGSNISLKDNQEEAEYQIKAAVQEKIKEGYGNNVIDARINVTKIYTAEDEEKDEILKEMKLGKNEVAFEVKIELKPSSNADVNLLTIPNGKYDEESGWVIDSSRLGILVQDEDDNTKYTIRNYGTGW